jgi:protein TonB
MSPGIATVMACVLALAAPAWAQQDALARAKTLYASAAYEDALQVLTTSGTATPAEAREVAAYQFFCLVALGRSDEARHAIETIVKVDPLYHPSGAQASPRVLAFFEDVRRPLLPDVVKGSYAQAKDAFEKKEMPAAASEFDRVIALLDEMGPAQGQSGSDMRTLAAGFRELAKAATPPPTPPPPAAPPPPVVAPARADAATNGTVPAPAEPVAPPAIDPMTVYGSEHLDVVRPVPIVRTIPEFTPANKFESTQTFRGAIDLVIDERGKVISAVIVKSVRSTYDPLLLKAAQSWTFRPATKQGVPVKYAYRMGVQVGR